MFFFDRFRQFVDRFGQSGAVSRPGSISHRAAGAPAGPARLEHFGWAEHGPAVHPRSVAEGRESQSFYRGVHLPVGHSESGRPEPVRLPLSPLEGIRGRLSIPTLEGQLGSQEQELKEVFNIIFAYLKKQKLHLSSVRGHVVPPLRW